MIPTRHPALQSFLDRMEAAVMTNAAAPKEARTATRRIFAALRTSTAETSEAKPLRLPACDHLPSAMQTAHASGALAARLADAMAELEPMLTWCRRPGAESLGAGFLDGHANSLIVGPNGIERRQDVWIGVSLMAPDLTYPDHRHPPEEVYVVLSKGDWRRDREPWFEPGLGGIVYNPPNIVHAMRSGPQPLLAAWCLWVGNARISDDGC